MNFRLPFQISRVSAICQSSSAVNLISKFTPIYGNHVKNQNKDKQIFAHHARIISNKCTYRTIQSPFNIYQQKAFLHDLANTEEAVKQRVRYEQNCDCQIPEEPKLAFRQTTKIQCFPCIDHRPCVAPPLIRPLKLYDDSKCLYKHKCNPNLCNINPRRMDNICCLKVEKKKLPPLPTISICRPCVDNLKKPLIAPKLCLPPKLYDPDKMKWKHENCEQPKCIRMDDACGYKVLPKELPVIPPNDCKPCVAVRALTAPVMSRPVLRYDPTCIPYPHPDCPCDKETLRRDHLLCEPICRDLPPMPCSDCIPCQPHVPTICPLLKRLRARYDSTEMEHKHESPQNPCDTPALRRDNNIISVTLTRKKLPKLIEDETCKPCTEYRPSTAPELRPPIRLNNNLEEEQNRVHCIEEKCVRRDGVIKIWRKCLPPVPISVCSKPCMDIFTPCTTPKFVPPKKLFDDADCKYRHTCVPDRCANNPPRMDDKCYKVIAKELPKPPNSPDCKPCFHHPKIAPRLGRPHKKYDDSKQKFKHSICPEDPCKVTPRADDITGIKDEAKSLQTYKPLKCKPCQQTVPCRAPILCRPRARYDSSCMLYEHKNCPTPCHETVFRRDHYLWEGPKKLPKVQCGTICQQCQVSYPTSAPPIGRPKKLYEFPHDPIRYKECPTECPPRRDDLLCWKPKRKKLPSFKDCDQCCCYSTLSWTNRKTINPKGYSEKLFSQNKTHLKHNFSKSHVSNLTKLSEKQKLYKSKTLNAQLKQTKQSSTKTNHIHSKPRYYILREPTWKCIDISEVQALNKTKNKYDYSIEKWLKEGADKIIKETTKSSSFKKSLEHIYNQFDIESKYSAESECQTPVKFTGYDNSGCNEYLFIKKNKKLQPLRIGSAFRSEDCLKTCDNISCNKTQSNSLVCISKDATINSNNNKSTTASVSILPKKLKKQYAFSTIIKERIKQHITSTSHRPTSNFILKLNNKMRSTLFQKISNFFRHRENAAKRRKIIESKSRPKLILERNRLNKELMANVYEKYDIEFNLNKLKTEKNKPYYVQKLKNQKLKFKVDKPSMCCCSTKPMNKNEERSNTKSLPKNMKMKVDQIRSFSTNSNGGKLYYKHIDISDDYIGKIYKVKLKKIGVKNLMLEKNDPDKMDEEPHTICYICKVVPRYQPVIDDDPPDIENVKINYYKEKRNTIE